MLKYFGVFIFVAFTISCAVEKTDRAGNRMGVRQLSESEKERYITATIYHIPLFDLIDNECANSDSIDLQDRYGRSFVKTCRKVYKSCLMQGTCQVSYLGQDGRIHKILLNVDKKMDDGRRSFKNINDSICKYGIGAATDSKQSYALMCLEPYYSVAADLSIYSLGDVIYIPHLKGLLLPNGKKHDGFVVVRDTGEAIKGKGRFDFFVGFHAVNRLNVLHKAGLSGGVHFPEYYVIYGEQAEKIRQLRKFPTLKKELK